MQDHQFLAVCQSYSPRSVWPVPLYRSSSTAPRSDTHSYRYDHSALQKTPAFYASGVDRQVNAEFLYNLAQTPFGYRLTEYTILVFVQLPFSTCGFPDTFFRWKTCRSSNHFRSIIVRIGSASIQLILSQSVDKKADAFTEFDFSQRLQPNAFYIRNFLQVLRIYETTWPAKQLIWIIAIPSYTQFIRQHFGDCWSSRVGIIVSPVLVR